MQNKGFDGEKQNIMSGEHPGGDERGRPQGVTAGEKPWG